MIHTTWLLHLILYVVRYQIAPDEDDYLHELLDDLGGGPSLCSLVGAADTSNESSLAALGM